MAVIRFKVTSISTQIKIIAWGVSRLSPKDWRFENPVGNAPRAPQVTRGPKCNHKTQKCFGIAFPMLRSNKMVP